MDCHKVIEEIREVLNRWADEIDPPKEKTLADVLNEHDDMMWTPIENGALAEGVVRLTIETDGLNDLQIETMMDIPCCITLPAIHALSDHIKEKYGE